MQCYFCHKNVEVIDRIGREERCSHCYGDLHVCMNCEFYDESAYNECRETQAERVVEKEVSNFCDYFQMRSGNLAGKSKADAVSEAKKKLEGLFKK